MISYSKEYKNIYISSGDTFSRTDYICIEQDTNTIIVYPEDLRDLIAALLELAK